MPTRVGRPAVSELSVEAGTSGNGDGRSVDNEVGDAPVTPRLVPRVTPSLATYALLDGAAVGVGALLAYLLRFGPSPGAELPGPGIPYVLIGLAALPTWLGVLALAGCYDRRVLGVGTEEYRRVLNGGVHYLAVVAILHFVFGLVFARGWVGVLIPVAVALTVGVRYGLRRWLYHERASGRYLRRLLLVGTTSTVVDVGEHLSRDAWAAGFRVVGVCLVPGDDNGRADNGGTPDEATDATGVIEVKIAGETVPSFGTVADVDAALVAAGADCVAVTHEPPPSELRELARALRAGPVDVGQAWPERRGADLLVVPAITDVAGPRTVVRHVAGLPLLHVEEPTFAGPQRLLKEAGDRVCAAIGLALLAPVFVAAAAAIRLDTPGPFFFRQARVGRDGHVFKMVKFRTMVRDAEHLQDSLRPRNDADGVLFKLRTDPRVTRVGRWLRRWSIDELPQLWNVLRGDMSLVGPRPPLPTEADRYESDVVRRLRVKPGITGLWQVSGRADLEWDEAVRLDLYYVDHWSPTMDVAIIFRTFWAVTRGSGAY